MLKQYLTNVKYFGILIFDKNVHISSLGGIRMNKKYKNIISVAIICIFLLLVIYKIGLNINNYFAEKKMYREAVSYINCGKVDKAREMFFRLGDYKESQSYVEDLLKNLEKGDSFLFGKYEQDGNIENGPEPIEWIVLGRSKTYA